MDIDVWVYFKPEISQLGNISGFTLSKTGWGEIYCSLSDFSSKLPKNIIKHIDRVKASCYFQVCPVREMGKYHLNKAAGELSVVKDNSYRDGLYCLTIIGGDNESVRRLYEAVRNGSIRPQQSYGKEQCKDDPRFASTIIRQINKILFKGFFFPLGFWREVRSIVRQAESEMTV